MKLSGGFILAMKLKLLAVGVDTVEIETGLESKTSDLYLQSFMELGSSLRMKYVSLLINPLIVLHCHSKLPYRHFVSLD